MTVCIEGFYSGHRYAGKQFFPSFAYAQASPLQSNRVESFGPARATQVAGQPRKRESVLFNGDDEPTFPVGSLYEGFLSSSAVA